MGSDGDGKIFCPKEHVTNVINSPKGDLLFDSPICLTD